ncbi:MAG: hypothetical protein A3F89_02095 [Deltaproteobacteria bacterium RIFCSPLOWO2_12_FULL_50_11]|nr:MAG: hypothetical protein A3F89_02095 [Deltaproteobacteria bacterium RIFCSPLOWO2_12_FULL_50_11]
MAAFLNTEPTSDPNVYRFIISHTFSEEESRDFISREEAAGDEIASPLFHIIGITRVTCQQNYIALTKKDEALWSFIIAPAINIIAARVAPLG